MVKKHISTDLLLKLYTLTNSFENPDFKKSTKLIKKTKSSIRTIRRYYGLMLPYNKTTGAQRVLCDSFYKLEKTASNLCKSLKGVYLPTDEKNNISQLYLFLKLAISDSTFLVSNNSICELIDVFEQKRYLKSIEFDLIQNLIRLSVVSIVAELVRKGNKNTIKLEKAICTMYAVDQLDMEMILVEKNKLEQLLINDPAKVYEKQTDKTKNNYRYMIGKLARLTQEDELLLARKYLKQANDSIDKNHVGFYIYDEYEKHTKKSIKKKLHLKLLYSIPAVAVIALCYILGNWYIAPILYLPMIEILRPIIEHFIRKGVEQDYAPRIELDSSVPKDLKTLVVVSTLVPEISELSTFKAKIERLILSNRNGEIGFVMLADLKPADKASLPNDKEKLNGANKVINELNRLYDNKLLLIVRKREFSKTQNSYIGRDRKRGAITDLISLINGEKIELEYSVGNMYLLDNTRYILALDYDTAVLLDSVSEFVEVAAHPINKPVIDYEKGIVKSGYGIIAPKIALDLTGSLKTPFTRVMGGIGGNTCYDQGCAELYQDLYGEGIFTGKGLIDVNVYNELIKDKFESETILSHDILEGLFLRARFVGDIEVIDGFPTNATGFFKRLHRWVRGDFQNTPFIFRKVKINGASKSTNLNFIGRYKVFDNLRREITSAFSMACLFVSAFVNIKLSVCLVLVAFLATTAPYLFSLAMKIIHGSITAFTTRNYSNTLPITREILLKALFEFVLLPQYAYIELNGAVRGLYRRYISRKNMLEWTTAAQVQVQANGMIKDVIYYSPCIIAGIILFFTKYIFVMLIGVSFICTLPIVAITRQKTKIPTLRVPKDKHDKLIDLLKSMLMYYNDFCNDENNFLPPDNMQQAPVFRVANRTSPTNIGLMMLSMLTARDFDLITSDRLCNYLTLTVDTIEKLEKFHGNLYNWYDTQTLNVLQPSFVSTVDSGNLVCSLVCLKEGLKEYEHEQKDILDLIKRIERLIEETNLSVFYNNKKKLFSIGYDTECNELFPSNYDMLMSEARMTSYYAIAKGQVPKKHWCALNRTLSRQGVHTGPISWTGTMFEYFMPELLIHSSRGSLSYEGLKYCIQCQKNRVKRLNVPYGISESGIYKFDSDLNYQYKANGVQRVALKRGMNDELVISPYSTILTLSHDFDSACDNLSLFESMHLKDKYGFYEAIDYTNKRIGDNGFQAIKSYMAHHTGMSVVAINNALNDNIMQKRFMRDKDMSRAKELLEEKMQVGGVVFFDQIKRESNFQVATKSELEEFTGQLHPNSPKVKIINNGELTSVITDVGASYMMFHKTDITRRPTDLLRNALGTFYFIKVNDSVMSLTYAPSYDNSCSYETSLTRSGINLYANSKFIQSKINVSMHHILPCEQRVISLKNISDNALDISMFAYVEPSLFGYSDDSTHKAFSKLFINITYDEETNTVIATRKKRSNEEIYYMAVGFRESIKFDLQANRENVFERGNVSCINKKMFIDEFEQSTGVPDPCIALRLAIKLMKGEKKEITMLTSVSTSRIDAINHIVALRQVEPINEITSAKSSLEQGTLEQRISQVILPQLLFNKRDSSNNLNAIRKNILGVTSLWQMSISGDLPIVLVDVLNENDTERVKAYAICLSLLKICGVNFDLIFLYETSENQEEKVCNVITKIVNKYCGDNVISQRGGVYIIDKTALDENQINLLNAVACHIATRSLVRIEAPFSVYTPIKIKNVRANIPQLKNSFDVYGGSFVDQSFYITKTPKLPWCHILANPTFGTLLSDKAIGYTWAINARENKLTPWFNDTMRDNNGEMLILKNESEYYDLANGAIPEFNPDYAQYHGEVDDIETKVKITVPKKGMIKYIEVNLYNKTNIQKNIDLCYYTEPVLGVNRDKSRQIKGELTNNILLLENPFNMSSHAYMGVSSTDENFDFVCDRPSFFCGKWDVNSLPPMQDMCAAINVKKALLPNKHTKICFQLCFATTKQGVLEQINLKPNEKYKTQNQIQVKTGNDSIDQMVNTWLPHQIRASRIYARTGFYQCGGAYGFRDQLQDVYSYMLLSPKIARTQIIRCCASQFEEGDVFHWWHNMPQSGGGKKGVRTRYSDDLVWLPFVVSEYMIATGDMSLLDVQVKYLKAEQLVDGQKDSYLEAKYTDYTESVYEHCKRALNKSYNLGRHGLPKIGSGDWNDGYSKVGIEGEGESVWLAQFISLTMREFSEIAQQMGEPQVAQDYNTKAINLLNEVDKHCYDQDHYIRAFYDNGEIMGSYQNEECRIDSLTQSFAAFSNMQNGERVKTALKTAYNTLVNQQTGIIKLFTPAFDKSQQNPGYVKSYPSGVRENGGQYTHAAVWLALAMCMIGENEEFFKLTEILNPINKYNNKENAERYLTEPYYMSADIYTNEYSFGRGGWSLYTGAAGWYYQLLVKHILGIVPQNNQIMIKPLLPPDISSYSSTIVYNGKKHVVNVKANDSKTIDIG